MNDVKKMDAFSDSSKSPTKLTESVVALPPEYTLHPMLDPVFQRWMGDPSICREFLEALFGHDVGEITIDKQPEINDPNMSLRRIRLDILAREQNIRIYNLEAQRQWYDDHNDRCLFYSCRQISAQLQPKDDFDKVKKTTVIFINMKNPLGRKLIDCISLRYDDSFDIFNDKLQIININLNKISELGFCGSDKLKFFILFCRYGHSNAMLNSYCEEYNLNFPNLRNDLDSWFDMMRGDQSITKAIERYYQMHPGIKNEEGYNMDELLVAENKGKLEGKVELLHDMNQSVGYIANFLSISEEEVRKILASLGKE